MVAAVSQINQDRCPGDKDGDKDGHDGAGEEGVENSP